MVYVTGDMHGCLERLYDKEFRKLKRGDTLIVCGDFGYIFDGSPIEKKVVDFLSSRRFAVAFVEGTHDNLERILRCRETIWHGGRVNRIKGTLFHLKRGQIFTIEGNTFFTFGGGESADKDMRVGAGLWWRGEEPTPDEMAQGVAALNSAGRKVDYVITHEPPLLMKSAMLMRQGVPERVSKLNGYFEEIGRACEFRHWYFGSLHEDRVITQYYTCVFKKLVAVPAAEKTEAGRNTAEAAEEIP